MMESRFVENDVGENGDPSLFQLKDETDLGVGKMADGVQSGQEKRIVVEMGAMGSRDDINNGLISTAERETSAIMTKKISEMAAVCNSPIKILLLSCFHETDTSRLALSSSTQLGQTLFSEPKLRPSAPFVKNLCVPSDVLHISTVQAGNLSMARRTRCISC